MRIALAVVVVSLCCGCAGPESTVPGESGEQGSDAAKREMIDTLVEQSSAIVLGKITGIRDATARDAGIVYDVVVETVLCGDDVPAEVLRFRSAGPSGYARYRMDSRVLLFLQRRDGQFVQLMPVCYVTGEPTPGALDLRPFSRYQSYVDEAIRSRMAK